MPIVPKSEAPRQSLQSPGMQTPNSGGGLVGEGLATLGRGVNSLTSDVLAVADKFTLMRDEMESDTRLAELRKYNTRLLSSPTPDEETGTIGLLQTRGAAAIDATVRYQEMTDKKIAELEKGLSPRALQVFRQSYAPILLSGIQSSQIHEGKEVNNAKQSASQGLVKAIQEDAINNYTTPPEAFEDLLGEMQVRFVMGEELNGVPTDPAALKTYKELQALNIETLRQSTIAARIATAIEANDIQAAEQTMASHGSELNDKQREGLNKAIGSAYASTATRNAIRYAVHNGGGDDRTKRQVKDQAVSYAQKEMKLVGRSLSPEQVEIIEKAAEAEYDDQVADTKRLLEKASSNILADLQIAIQANGVGEGGAGYMDHQAVKATYIDVISRLDAIGDNAGRSAAEEAFNAWRENPSMGGFAAITDPTTAIEIDGMTDDDLAKMTDAQLNGYKPRLTKTRWDALNKQRKTVLSGKTPVEKTNLTRAQVQDRVAQALKAKQLVPSLKTSAYSVEDAQLLTSTVDLVFTYAGPDASPEAIQKAIATAVFEQSEKFVGFFGGESSLSPAELIESPNRASQTVLRTIESRYGYTQEQLEDAAIRRMALTQYFQDEAKRKRKKQLNDGKFDE